MLPSIRARAAILGFPFLLALACGDDAASPAQGVGPSGGAAGAAGSTTSAPRPDGPATYEGFGVAAARIFCERLAGCCGRVGNTPSPTCENDTKAILLEDIPEGYTYLPERGAACLAAVATIECDLGVNIATDRACRNVLRRAAYQTKNVGETAEDIDDCIHPPGFISRWSTTIKHDGSFFRTCLAPAKIEPAGASCVDEVGADGSGRAHTCDDELECEGEPRVCTPYPPPGGSCADVGDSCAGSAICFQHTCTPLLDAGEKCDGRTPCRSAACVGGVCVACQEHGTCGGRCGSFCNDEDEPPQGYYGPACK